MSRTAKHAAVPLTTAQQLASLVKSARDIMRKDRRLAGPFHFEPFSVSAFEPGGR
ncbi:MAG TPA: hypothetical protein VMH22_09960 [bacterium]|nr:hypothetical protein [bacterium]